MIINPLASPFFDAFDMMNALDILLFGFFLYLFLSMIRGTIATSLFTGFVLLCGIYLAAKHFNLELISEVFKPFFQIGSLSLIIIFQPEIRRFILLIGQNFLWRRLTHWYKNRTQSQRKKAEKIHINYIRPVIEACKSMQESRTGALIVFARKDAEERFYKNGQALNALISKALIETVFSKNGPLHDGALVIENNKIRSASCILPLTESQDLPAYMGLRHRAAMGISEVADVLALVVSEETGQISYAKNGTVHVNCSYLELEKALESRF